MWSKKHCDTNPNTQLKDILGSFLEYIQFHKIPANVLMRDIHPLGIVPYHIIMNALAYQVQFDIDLKTVVELVNMNGMSWLRHSNPVLMLASCAAPHLLFVLP